MRRLTVVLLLATGSLTTALGGEYDEEPAPVTCEARCLRIHERSLDRIEYNKVGADRLIDKVKPDPKELREVCWKQYDYFYCLKGCSKSKDHEKYVRHVKTKCKHAVEDLEPGLSCLFKYRSFLEIRCSSFLNEAIRLKQNDDPDLLPDKETCRYLHLNALCLENSVSSFCPQATPFFQRLNLRDYFLNHILPQDDELFDDQDLDACQMKDFVKEALEGVRVSTRHQENEENVTSLPSHSSTHSHSTTTSIIDYDEDSDEIPLPSTTPPAIVRTLSPSTRSQSHIQTSTTSNFVYTTPTRKQPSSTLMGTSTTPIHITKEQAMRTSTTRAGMRKEGRITVTPKPPSTTTPAEKPTTKSPSTTTTRRRIFESEEDFSQTPPNFVWGSFRGENYKVARNYSESFPANAEFVTPVTIESSSLFGDDDDDSRDEDYGKAQVIDIDRGLTPVTVTGRPVDMSTIVTLVDEKNKKATDRTRSEEDSSSPIYEHAVDTQLQPTTPLRPVTLHSGESTTTPSRVLPTDSDADEEDDDNEEEKKEEEEKSKQLPVDVNDIKFNEMTEEEIEEEIRAGLHPESRGFDSLPVDVVNDKQHRNEAENNFDRALQKDKEEGANEIRAKSASEELLNLKPTMTTTMPPEPFTPLINGGRVAVKSIKKFRTIGEDSGQDWTEDPNLDDAHVDVGDVDDYDKEVYVTSEIQPDESRGTDVRRRINFILAYSALFFTLLLLVVCCILCVIVRNRRNAHLNRPYKHTDL